jgi:hypothetical protein
MCAEIDGIVIKEKELTKRKILHAVTKVKGMSSAQRERKKKKEYFLVSGNSQVRTLGMSLNIICWCTPSAPKFGGRCSFTRSMYCYSVYFVRFVL